MSTSNMREELIQTGVRFMKNPKIKDASRSTCASFLEKKGLTTEEISEVFARLKNDQEDDHDASSQNHSNQPSNQPSNTDKVENKDIQSSGTRTQRPSVSSSTPSTSWSNMLYPILGLVGLGGSIGWITRSYTSSYFPLTQDTTTTSNGSSSSDEKEKFSQELQKLASQVNQQSDELEKVLYTLRQSELLLSSLEAKMDTNQILELQNEIESIKKNLVSVSPSKESIKQTTQTTLFNEESHSLPSKNEDVNLTKFRSKECTVEKIQYKINAILKAFSTLLEENSSNVIKEACGMMLMYTKNLLDNPDTPRYRRISITNTNFQQRITPLKGHMDFLQQIGFASSGNTMEWGWYNSDKQINPHTGSSEYDDDIAILKSTVTILSLAKSEISFEEIASKAKTGIEQYTSKLSAVPPKSSSSEKPSPSDESTLDFNSFLKQLKSQGDSLAPVCPKPKTATMDEKKMFPGQTDTSDIPIESKESGTVTTLGNDDDQLPEPSYPSSFAQVVKMVQNGETVPGIKTIEDKLSIDAGLSTEGTNQIPKKPWEK